ncbi:hypothetical protein ATN84_20110 [Paramesorhizobium deserti]|uniref:Uncharacterized protein n=1 Tax=Paramesorhizobium deserti TaxID=1494590 RepID=A0A135HP57_9HYPH|nr:hypothetical protein [Paramesorhizobium deserti]KXF74998.1 hypothetical protein ATN84_20110 [Paramesorhizobium deserti]
MADLYDAKWETIATVAPVGVEYPVVVSVATLPPDPNDRYVIFTPTKGTMEPKVPIDASTLQATGKITVADAEKGSVSIKAQVASDTPITKPITFQEWDDPNDPTKTSTLTPISAAVVGPIVDQNNVPPDHFDDAHTILLTIQLTDYQGNGIVGAEVQWDYTPAVPGPSFRSTTMVGQDYPAAPGVRQALWYPIRTTTDGKATLRLASTQTWKVTASATVPGAEKQTYAVRSQPVVIASITDTTPEEMRQAVTTDAVNGVLDVTGGNTFALHLPDPSTAIAQSTWGTPDYTTFLVLQGQGEHLLFSDINAPDLPENDWEPTGILYNGTDNEQLHNTPVLYAQTDRPKPYIYRSSRQSFGTSGEIANMPPANDPPKINRRSDISSALVGVTDWTVRPGSWISGDDLLNWKLGGLPVVVKSEMPSDVLDSKWYLFFALYPNGVDKSGYQAWPDPQGDVNKFLKVGTGNSPYSAVIPSGFLSGYGADMNGRGSESYLDLYITPLNKYQDTPTNRASWFFAGSYLTYKLNT